MAEELSGHADPDSHDRDFLDPIVDKIIHIEQQACSSTPATTVRLKYSAPPVGAATSDVRKPAGTRSAFAKFIDRFRAKATKAKQAQSRIKSSSVWS